MRVLDLFSGIGGFSLGLERAGMRTVAFCEIDPYCRAILAKHWPGVPCHDDIRIFAGVPCDVICGGFPCQDISLAGKGAGLSGERSGLWTEYARLIRELRPRYVIVENVSALLSRGLGAVLGDLAAIGYDAQWHCVPASHIGAPHRRDRIWIVAYPARFQSGRQEQWSERERARQGGESEPVADASGERSPATWHHEKHGAQAAHRQADWPGSGGQVLANSDGNPRDEGLPSDAAEIERRRNADRGGQQSHVGDADGEGRLQPSWSIGQEWRRPSDSSWWLTEPDVGRVAHGIPSRVDRLRCLGNAVVPQIPEIIGRAIMRAAQPQEGSPDV